MKLDERHLVQLAAVVQTGSVSAGAELLGMTQPAVSRTLAQLEKRLGVTLFEKGQRPIKPTPLGKALAEHGRTILTASRKASDTVINFRKGGAGIVRLGGTPFFMDALVSGMIASFQRLKPDVRVDQTYGYVADLRDALLMDRIDIAICPIDLLEEGSGLVFKELLPGRNVVACRSVHPLLSKRRLKTESLLDYPWVAPPPGSPLHADMRSILYSLGATEIKVRYTGASLAAVIRYLELTDALTVLPHGTVFAFRQERRLSALPIKVPHPDRALGILRLADAPDVPAVAHFIEHIKSEFSDVLHLIKRHEESVIWGG